MDHHIKSEFVREHSLAIDDNVAGEIRLCGHLACPGEIVIKVDKYIEIVDANPKFDPLVQTHPSQPLRRANAAALGQSGDHRDLLFGAEVVGHRENKCKTKTAGGQVTPAPPALPAVFRYSCTTCSAMFLLHHLQEIT